MGVIFILAAMLVALYVLYNCCRESRRRRRGLGAHSSLKRQTSFNTPHRPFLSPSPRRSGRVCSTPSEAPLSASPPPTFLQDWIDSLLPETEFDAPYNPASNPTLANSPSPASIALLPEKQGPIRLEDDGTLPTATAVDASAEAVHAHVDVNDAIHSANAASGQEGDPVKYSDFVVSTVGYTAVSGVEPESSNALLPPHKRLSHEASYIIDSSTFVSAASGDVVTGVHVATGTTHEESPSATSKLFGSRYSSPRPPLPFTRSQSQPSSRPATPKRYENTFEPRALVTKGISEASELAELDSAAPKDTRSNSEHSRTFNRILDGDESAEDPTATDAATVGGAAPGMEGCTPLSVTPQNSPFAMHGHHACLPGGSPSSVVVGYMLEQPKSSLHSDKTPSQLLHLRSIASSVCGPAVGQGQLPTYMQQGRPGGKLGDWGELNTSCDPTVDLDSSRRISDGLPGIIHHHPKDSIASELGTLMFNTWVPPTRRNSAQGQPPPTPASRLQSLSSLPHQQSFASPFRQTRTITARECYSAIGRNTASLGNPQSEGESFPPTVGSSQDVSSVNSVSAPFQNGSTLQNRATLESAGSAPLSTMHCKVAMDDCLETVPEASKLPGGSSVSRTAPLSGSRGTTPLHALSGKPRVVAGDSVSGVLGVSDGAASKYADSQLTDLSTLMREHNKVSVLGDSDCRSVGVESISEECVEPVAAGTHRSTYQTLPEAGLLPGVVSRIQGSIVARSDAMGTDSSGMVSSSASRAPWLRGNLLLASETLSVDATRSTTSLGRVSRPNEMPVPGQRGAPGKLGGILAGVKASLKGWRRRWGPTGAPLGPPHLECDEREPLPQPEVQIACTTELKQSAFEGSGSATGTASGDVSSFSADHSLTTSVVTAGELSSHACIAAGEVSTGAGAPAGAFDADGDACQPEDAFPQVGGASSSGARVHAFTSKSTFDALQQLHGPSTTPSDDLASAIPGTIDSRMHAHAACGTGVTGATPTKGSSAMVDRRDVTEYSNASSTGVVFNTGVIAASGTGKKLRDAVQSTNVHSSSSLEYSSGIIRNSSSSSRLAPGTPSWTLHTPSAGAFSQCGGSPKHVQGLAVCVTRSQSGSASGTPPPHTFNTRTSSTNSPTTQPSEGSPSLHVPATLLSHVEKPREAGCAQHAQHGPSTHNGDRSPLASGPRNNSMHATCTCKAVASPLVLVSTDTIFGKVLEATECGYESFGIAGDGSKESNDDNPRRNRSTSDAASVEYSGSASRAPMYATGTPTGGVGPNTTAMVSASTHSSPYTPCTATSPVLGSALASALAAESDASAGDSSPEAPGVHASASDRPSRLRNVLQSRQLASQSVDDPLATLRPDSHTRNSSNCIPNAAGATLKALAPALADEAAVPASLLLNRISSADPQMSAVGSLPVALTDEDVSMDDVGSQISQLVTTNLFCCEHWTSVRAQTMTERWHARQARR